MKKIFVAVLVAYGALVILSLPSGVERTKIEVGKNRSYLTFPPFQDGGHTYSISFKENEVGNTVASFYEDSTEILPYTYISHLFKFFGVEISGKSIIYLERWENLEPVEKRVLSWNPVTRELEIISSTGVYKKIKIH